MQIEGYERLEILYQDGYLVAINKPSGLLVHKSPIDKHETRFALQEVRNQIGQYVYPIHRLDKPTSGVLLFALDKQFAKAMSELFREHHVQKEYVAIVRGYIDKKGCINHPLKQMLDTKAQKIEGITKEEQEAQTEYEGLETIELPYSVSRYATVRYSLVKLMPKTGRKHQLRRHMKHIHHHIIGDTKHGRGEHNTLFRGTFDSHRLLLHAYKITFRHPHTHRTVEISASFDETFKSLFKRFEWKFEV